MIPDASRCLKMSPDDSRWTQMTPDDSRWIQMTPDGSRWLQMFPDGSRCFQMIPDDSRFLQQVISARWTLVLPFKSPLKNTSWGLMLGSFRVWDCVLMLCLREIWNTNMNEGSIFTVASKIKISVEIQQLLKNDSVWPQNDSREKQT